MPLFSDVTLGQETAFALASVPVLTVVFICRGFNLVTSEFGSHNRIRDVWEGSAQSVIFHFLCLVEHCGLCITVVPRAVLVSVLCRYIIANVFCLAIFRNQFALCGLHFCCLGQYFYIVTIAILLPSSP